MRTRYSLLLGTAFSLLSVITLARTALAQPPGKPVVRLAELEIDPSHLDQYTALLKEEIEASIRLEPGVITLYAVTLKDHPNQIRLFEIYSSQAAYLAHRETPHFKKYKAQTQEMVKSLTLLEADPLLLGTKLK